MSIPNVFIILPIFPCRTVLHGPLKHHRGLGAHKFLLELPGAGQVTQSSDLLWGHMCPQRLQVSRKVLLSRIFRDTVVQSLQDKQEKEK